MSHLDDDGGTRLDVKIITTTLHNHASPHHWSLVLIPRSAPLDTDWTFYHIFSEPDGYKMHVEQSPPHMAMVGPEILAAPDLCWIPPECETDFRDAVESAVAQRRKRWIVVLTKMLVEWMWLTPGRARRVKREVGVGRFEPGAPRRGSGRGPGAMERSRGGLSRGWIEVLAVVAARRGARSEDDGVESEATTEWEGRPGEDLGDVL
ncbi:hypothetical protein BJX61DRAFT_540221 [Aspergillus egyptiacus]|nr:hypothetical protein BJX61DRAFT_540221 [Aspergillus egyptiacus]